MHQELDVKHPVLRLFAQQDVPPVLIHLGGLPLNCVPLQNVWVQEKGLQPKLRGGILRVQVWVRKT